MGRVASVEQVRLTSSGTEATMSAIRVARGATGRDRIVKFAGELPRPRRRASWRKGAAAWRRSACPGSAGVTAGAVADTLVAPYNVVPVLDEQVAAVIVEPIAANMGLVPPAPGFLEGLRRSATGSARCSSSTRSSPGSGWRTAGPRRCWASRPT